LDGLFAVVPRQVTKNALVSEIDVVVTEVGTNVESMLAHEASSTAQVPVTEGPADWAIATFELWQQSAPTKKQVTNAEAIFIFFHQTVDSLDGSEINRAFYCKTHQLKTTLHVGVLA
jgi:hypothetical protein